MRKTLFLNKTLAAEHLGAPAENLEAKTSFDLVTQNECTILLEQPEQENGCAISGEVASAQICQSESSSLPQVSRELRRLQKKLRRKKIRKLRRARRRRRKLRKKSVAFLSKYNFYSYFSFKKPLLPSAKKKEIRRRLRKTWVHKITIRVSSNNIFCTLSENSPSQNRILLAKSAGQYKIKITKKRLKRQHKPFLKKFFSKAWPHLGLGGIMVFITAPIRLRKKIMSLVLKLRSYRLKSKKKRGRRAIFIKIWRKKCFNGCQSAKRRRKKRKGIRLTK